MTLQLKHLLEVCATISSCQTSFFMLILMKHSPQLSIFRTKTMTQLLCIFQPLTRLLLCYNISS